jgi:hypothetical protein
VNPAVNTISVFKKLDKAKPAGAEIPVGTTDERGDLGRQSCLRPNALDGTVSVVDLVAKEVVNTYHRRVEPAAVVLSPTTPACSSPTHRRTP